MLSSLCLVAAAAVVTAPPAIPVNHVKLTRAKAGAYEAEAVYPQFHPKTPVLMLANRDLTEKVKSSFDEFTKSADEFVKDMGNPSHPWEMSLTSTVSMVDANLVSVVTWNYSFSGGAHPNTVADSYTYGLVGGKAQRLTLADILVPGQTPKQFGDEVVLPLLNEQKMKRAGDTLDTIALDSLKYFIVSRTHLTWVFSAYVVGPYVEGEYTVKVPIESVRDRLNVNGPLKPILAAADPQMPARPR